MIIVIMKTLEPWVKGSSYTVAVFTPCVADLSFIVTCVHQKIKPLFCRINFGYTQNFVKECFVFFHLFSFEHKKKRKIHTKLDRASKFILTFI